MLGSKTPGVMGILNVTPDSFSDGGKYIDVSAAVDHAVDMINEGASIIDIGGESTRPGAGAVTTEEELRRVIPVITALRKLSDVPISVDTSTPEVMAAAITAGASMINDVRALQRPGAIEVAATSGLPVCLMHMRGEPRTMQANLVEGDPVPGIIDFFRRRMDACLGAGMQLDKIVLDPGFGFGKTPTQNLQIINRLQAFKVLGRPLLVGLSRKSTIGAMLSGLTQDRLCGSVAGAVIAVMHGANFVRVHDVGPTVQALRVVRAITEESMPEPGE